MRVCQIIFEDIINSFSVTFNLFGVLFQDKKERKYHIDIVLIYLEFC